VMFLFSFLFLPTPEQPSPSPLIHSLIGSDIILINSALLWVASGEGGGARGKGHAQGTASVGHALFCFFSSEGVGSLRGLPLVLLLQRPLPCLAAATPSTSISPAWPYSYRDACTLPHLPRGFAQLRWAVVASLAWFFFFFFFFFCKTNGPCISAAHTTWMSNKRWEWGTQLVGRRVPAVAPVRADQGHWPAHTGATDGEGP